MTYDPNKSIDLVYMLLGPRNYTRTADNSSDFQVTGDFFCYVTTSNCAIEPLNIMILFDRSDRQKVTECGDRGPSDLSGFNIPAKYSRLN